MIHHHTKTISSAMTPVAHPVISARHAIRHTLALLWLAGACGFGFAHAENVCIHGFDVGSSGIRIGSTAAPGRAKVNIDYLDDVWVDKRIDTTIGETLDAFQTLPAKAALPTTCVPLAGGYSVWRLAAEQGDRDELAKTLKKIQAESGVYLFVIPQIIEGRYAYQMVVQSLGERLHTPYILDIGGGSLQIASANQGWGAPLGQRSWYRMFCEQIKHTPHPQCLPNPIGQDGWQQARQLLQHMIAGAPAELGKGVAVTAISKPVAYGVLPVLSHLLHHGLIKKGAVDASGFDREALEGGIAALAALDDEAILLLLDGCRGPAFKSPCQKPIISTMVTDMLLLQSLMETLEMPRLEVSQADITNVDGIMADAQAMAWSKQFDCYLERLRTVGTSAYLTDPSQCTSAPQ